MTLTQRNGWRTSSGSRPLGRVLVVVLVIWFAIGAIAAAQRHYFSNSRTTCASTSTTTVTVLAGPLNYFGVNPKTTCHLPQPSK